MKLSMEFHITLNMYTHTYMYVYTHTADMKLDDSFTEVMVTGLEKGSVFFQFSEAVNKKAGVKFGLN